MDPKTPGSAAMPLPERVLAVSHASLRTDDAVRAGKLGPTDGTHGLAIDGVQSAVAQSTSAPVEVVDCVRSLPESVHQSAPRLVENGSRIRLEDIGRAIERCGRNRNRSERTLVVYVEWARRYVMFHACRHPLDMGMSEVEVFIRDLALRKKVAASTQNQALQALIFLYQRVLQVPLPVNRVRLVRAKRMRTLPEVLSRTQVAAFFKQLVGIPRIVAWLQYGSGLRVMEALRLRVDDVHLAEKVVMVPGRRGVRRAVPLPQSILEPLTTLIAERRQQWTLDQQRPHAKYKAVISRKSEIGSGLSPYIFSGTRARRHTNTGVVMRHHVDEHFIQSWYRMAYTTAGISAPVSTLTLRHCFAVHVIERGGDVRTVQEILGQRDIRTTMLYFQVSQRGPACVMSPADDL